MRPAKSILDRSFRYVPALATSVVETWRRFGWRPMTDEERKKLRRPAAGFVVESMAAIRSFKRAAPR